MQSELLHNDPDLLLAKKIGSLLDQDLPLSEELRGSEAWLDALLDYRDESASSTLITSDPAQTVVVRNDRREAEWAAIEAAVSAGRSAHTGSPIVKDQTQTQHLNLPVIHSLASRPAWMAAAAILVVALFTGIYLYSTSETPVYVAESTATQTVYTAPDGSVITLRPWSTLRQLDRGDGQLAYAVQGEAYFEVVHDAGRTFRVETGNAVVTVLGTRFTAGDIGGKARVYLRSGSVQVASGTTGDSAVLQPGHFMVIDTGGKLGESEAISDEEAMGWLYNQLNFSSRPASRVIAELEHHFRIHIELPAGLGDEAISGRILLDDPARALGDAAVALGGRFTQTGENRYVFTTN